MARGGRVLYCGIAAGAVAVFLGALRPEAAQAPFASEGGKLEAAERPERREPLPSSDAHADIARFVALLDRLRADDEAVLSEMGGLADRLCNLHDRCDGRAILEYYASLPSGSRSKGRQESIAIDDAWTRICLRLTDPSWEPRSDDDVAFLRRSAAESANDGDICPSAMAQSFLAYIDLVRPIASTGSSDSDRADWLEATAEEAQRSIAGFARCGMRLRTLQPMWVLGKLELESGRDREAESRFRDCLALARKTQNADWRERALEGLIHVAKRAGDLGQVAELLEELASFRTPDSSWLLTGEKALLLLEHDFASTAAEFLAEHRPSDSGSQRDWQVLYGGAQLRRGDLIAARDAFASAEPPPWKKDVKIGMALIDLRGGHAERALEQLSADDLLEDIDPFARAFVQQIRGEALVRMDRFDEAIRCLEEALSIGGKLQTRIATQRNLTGTTTSVIGESVGVHAIALLAEARIRSGQALEAARSIEGWQSRTLRQATGAAEDLSSDDILAWAKSAGGGLLTWVVGPDSSAVVFVGSDGRAQGATIPRGRRAIDAAVRRLRDAIRADDLVLADRLGAEVLAGILPEPIGRRAREQREAGERLLFLVHGPLERLPIEYLLSRDRRSPLVLPGLPEPRPGDAIVPHDLARWNVLGHPIDADGQARLPGAREELSRVAMLRGAPLGSTERSGVFAASASGNGVSVSLGSSFDRKSLLDALARPDALHLATHLVSSCGDGKGRIAGVGLELSDGESLCAREILDVRPRLPLAVLSACETAEGRFVDAEGLQGVARAFLESGTRNLIVTLWPVEDGAARDFAEAFHRALLAGELPGDAAASARASLMRNQKPAADWAAFRSIGRD